MFGKRTVGLVVGRRGSGKGMPWDCNPLKAAQRRLAGRVGWACSPGHHLRIDHKVPGNVTEEQLQGRWEDSEVTSLVQSPSPNILEREQEAAVT